METQNITLGLSKALLKKVRILAAQRETSISALVAASLEEAVRAAEGYEPAMGRALARARAGYDLGSGGRLAFDRDALHER